MMWLIGFLSHLFLEPDDFAGSAYGFIANQISHFAFGVIAPMLTVWGWQFFVTQYPPENAIALAWIVGFATVWEMGVHRWRGLDTVLDVFFFGGGASIFFLIDFDIVVDRLAPVTLVVLTVLVARAAQIYEGGDHE